MADDRLPPSSGAATVIEDDSGFTLVEFCRACSATPDEIHLWVMEGVLQPVGQGPHDWCFSGAALRRARLATHIARDLEINAPGVALALDLMDQIDDLKARLQRAGLHLD